MAEGWLTGRKSLARYLDCSIRQVSRYREMGAPIIHWNGTMRAKAADLDKWLRSLDEGRCPSTGGFCPLRLPGQ
jgi:phage terminase Nu1 subunit (DNA packaging protein)